MDSFTQIVLGAAVGEAVAGKKAKNQALIWGAVAGTIPDLDVFAAYFMDTADYLIFHRGFTHSFLFAFIAAPILGWIIFRFFNKKHQVDYKTWSWLMFWGLFTHPILDCFTTYGTQVFLPFLDYPVAFATIHVIDPLYTIPLTIGIILALWYRRSNPKQSYKMNGIGLILSSLYLIFTVGNKLGVLTTFDQQAEAQNIQVNRMMVVPTLANNVYWYALIESDNGYWVGEHSLLSFSNHVTFTQLSQSSNYPDELNRTEKFKRLRWFANDWLLVNPTDAGWDVVDLRFGPTNSWQSDSKEWSFAFKVALSDQDDVSVERVFPSTEIAAEAFPGFIDRVLGKF